MVRVIAALALVAAIPPAAATAHESVPVSPARTAAEAETPCPGRAIDAAPVVQGRFDAAQEGSHVMVPFTVPAGTTAVRVKYCHDQPDGPLSSRVRHTLDLGLYDPPAAGRQWGPADLRGWGGSSHPDVTVSPEGFAPYGRQAPGKTTRAFRPGPIEPGHWAVELGLAAIMDEDLGDSDGGVKYRVEIELSRDPRFADEPYEPAEYPTAAARREAGWYAGDLHVHGEHSALGDASLTEVLRYAFKDAKLDFFTLSDYVGGAQWDEIGRFAAKYPRNLVVRSAEVITYRGHANNHASATTVDHRTGPVLELDDKGRLKTLRDAQPASRMLGEIREAGGVTQINHPTIFPTPASRLLCRGCPWDYSDEETDFSRVDAIEVATGPGGLQDVEGGLGPNPFTATAIAFYERALATGAHIAAVGSSDSHRAGHRADPVTQAPIGQATTVVHAPELSEAGIACGIRAGHTFVKVWGADRPDLRLEARLDGSEQAAIFGDTIRGGVARFTARVLRAEPEAGQPFQLQVVKDGMVIAAHQVSPDDQGRFEVRFDTAGHGRYGLRLMRGSSIEAISTPIWFEPAGERGAGVVTRSCAGGEPRAGARRSLRDRRRARRHARRAAAAHRAAVSRARSRAR